MNEKEFNLIDEPWIRVMDESCKVCEVSLLDAIVNAQKYKRLSGELPTQDVAVMRLILAVLHTVVSRYDEYGDENVLEDSESDALDRWKGLWEQGYFPENAVREYLEQWHERFWLFHPDRPFGQVAGLTKGTKINAMKLNGEIAQSNNKIRFFSSYFGDDKNTLTYAQAARWLLYINSYDDVALKPDNENKAKVGGKLPSAKRGWLGQLGLVYLNGNNLFETLMLNLVIICDDVVQCEQKPLWEADSVSDRERTEIYVPENLAELYTVQFRRIILQRVENKVVSCLDLVGDFFVEEAMAFKEPMTLWRKRDKKSEIMIPKKHDSSKQMWREFSTIFGNENEKYMAVVVKWFEKYLYKNYLPKNYIMKTTILSLVYDEKQATSLPVINVFTDSLSMHSAILSEVGSGWRSVIETEIQHCEDLAKEIGIYARNLYIASGGSDNDTENIRTNAKSQLYYRLDVPFRKWLLSINPDAMGQSRYDIIKKWQDEARKIAADYADELMENTAECALIGHVIKGEKKNEIYSAPKAKNVFYSNVNKIYERSDKNE